MPASTITAVDGVEPRRGARPSCSKCCAAKGVRYIFGNPGMTELALMDALTGAPDINYIWGLQEASVVAMADGYAQASGKPGFVNLHTAGEGFGFWFARQHNDHGGRIDHHHVSRGQIVEKVFVGFQARRRPRLDLTLDGSQAFAKRQFFVETTELIFQGASDGVRLGQLGFGRQALSQPIDVFTPDVERHYPSTSV